MDDRTRELLERMREETDRLRRTRIARTTTRRTRSRRTTRRRTTSRRRTRRRTRQERRGKRTRTGRGNGRRPAVAGRRLQGLTRPTASASSSPRSTTSILADEGKEAEAVQLTTDGEEDYSFSGRRRFGGRGRHATTRRRRSRPADRKTRPNVDLVAGLEELLRHPDRLARHQGTVPGQLPGRAAADAREVQVPDARRGGRPQERTVLLRRRPPRSSPSQAEVEGRALQQHPLGQDRRRAALRPPRPAAAAPRSSARSTPRPARRSACIAEGFENANLDYQPIRYLDESDEMIWWSERTRLGPLLPVRPRRQAEERDHDRRLPGQPDRRRRRQESARSTSRGNAREPGENVYYNHLYRVHLDGTDLTLLDPGDACSQLTRRGLPGANHRRTCRRPSATSSTTARASTAPPMSYVLDAKGNQVMDLEHDRPVGPDRRPAGSCRRRSASRRPTA